MTSIDDRIVSIKFDNANFESKVSATLASLDKLTAKLNLTGASKGLTDVGKAANNIDLSSLNHGVDNISSKFSVMGAVAFTAIQTITTSIFGMAKKLAVNDFLGPVITGGKQRALNIDQAKYMFRGLGVNVEAGMKVALGAVKDTAYGLDEAAKTAAQFAASGIPLEKMGPMLRGIAGMAAMTGKSFTEMSYLSTTAAAANKITNIDLQQYSTRGLNAAAAYAKVIGKTEAQVHEMAASGNIDFESFALAMDKTFGPFAKKANETYAGSLANMHAAMSRLGAVWFGPEQLQQRDLFNALTPVIDNLNKALAPLINTMLGIRQMGLNGILKGLKGMDFSNLKIAMPNIQAGVLNAFDALGRVLHVIKSAFRDIFPPSATSQLVNFSEGFKNFTNHLKMGAETAAKVKSVFKGFFSIVAIGWTVIKELALVVKDLVKSLFPAAHGFLNFSASTGDLLTNLKKVLVDGGGIHRFFTTLGDKISGAIKFIVDIKNKIVDFFSADVGSNRISSRLTALSDGAEHVSSVWDTLMSHLHGVFAVFDVIWDYISNWFSELGSKIAAVMKPADFNAAVDVVNIGLLGGILGLLHKFMTGGVKFGFGGGLVTKISSTLSGVTKSLKAMQTELQAKALLKIAIALGILTASIVVLSMIDSAALTKALVAISVGFAELAGIMLLLDKSIAKTGGAFKLSILAGALIGLAVAIGILAISIKILSGLSWTELAKGLGGVAVGLGLLVLATQLLSTDSSGLIRAGLAMIPISIGLWVLSKAVKSFATMSWSEISKGLVGVGVGLGLLVLAMNNMPPSSILSGAGFIELAIGLNILAGAVKLFSMMSWSELGKGLLGIAGALLAIAIGMNLMPLSLPITAAGIFILSAALLVMAKAVKSMGSNDLGTLAKGIGAFAAMLIILSVAVIAMDGSLTGAAALLIVSSSLLIMAKVLQVLGTMDLAQIAIGLGAVAAVFIVLGVAAALLTETIPAMIGLGIALGTIGVAFALFGGAIFLLALGLQVLATTGVAGTVAFVESLKVLAKALPQLAAAAALFITHFVEEILNAVPLLLKLVTALLEQILETIIKEVPKIVKALGVIIAGFLQLVRDNFPDIVQTGYFMLIALLTGLRDNIGEIVTLVAEIITGFLDALALKVPEIIDSVYNLVTAIIKGVVLKFVDLAKEFIPIGLSLLGGMLSGLWQKLPDILKWFGGLPGLILGSLGELTVTLVSKGLELLGGLLAGIIQKMPEILLWWVTLPYTIVKGIVNLTRTLVPKGFELLGGLLTGIGEKLPSILSWFLGLPGKIIHGIVNLANTLVPKGLELIGGLLTGIGIAVLGVFSWFADLPGKIKDRLPDFGGILSNIGQKIIEGLWAGMSSAVDWLQQQVTHLLSWLPGWAKKLLGIHSPSKVFAEIGKQVVQGLVVGIEGMLPEVKSSANAIISGLTDALVPDTKSINSAIFSVISSLSDMGEFNPVITPVLDLTNIQSAANTIDGYLKISSISPDISLQQANLISSATQPSSDSNTPTPTPGPTSLTFEQTINSPTALSTNDIYRNTKSQIALAKEGLGIS